VITSLPSLTGEDFTRLLPILGTGKANSFTVTWLNEQGIVPELVMVAIDVVKKEFREIKTN